PAQVAPIPTLRDMLLNHHSPSRPPPMHDRAQSAGQRAKPLATISLNLGNMSLDAKQREKQARIHHQQQQQQQQMQQMQHLHVETNIPPSSASSSSAESTPERLISTVDQNRSRSVTGGSEGELTKSEDEVRDRLQKVRIALSRGNSVMGSISENSDSADKLEQDSERPATSTTGGDARAIPSAPADDEDPVIEIDEDIQALYRDIDEVSRMLPSSQGSSQHEDDHSDEDGDNRDQASHGSSGRKQQKTRSSEDDARTEGLFVDVVIDQQPMDVGLENMSVNLEHDATAKAQKKTGSPGKRKLSDGGKS
ncbi:hypothetical protein LPJ56_006897, partial [Coemansia sp. RSA 2599]